MKRNGIIGFIVAVVLMAIALPSVAIAQEEDVKHALGFWEGIKYDLADDAGKVEILAQLHKERAEEAAYLLKKDGVKDELDEKISQMASYIDAAASHLVKLDEEGVNVSTLIETSYERDDEAREALVAAVQAEKAALEKIAEIETDENKLEKINEKIDYLDGFEALVKDKLEPRVEKLEELADIDGHGKKGNSEKRLREAEDRMRKLEDDARNMGFEIEHVEIEHARHTLDDSRREIGANKFDDGRKHAQDVIKIVSKIRKDMNRHKQLLKKVEFKCGSRRSGTQSECELKFFTRSSDMSLVNSEISMRIQKISKLRNKNFEIREIKTEKEKGATRVVVKIRLGTATVRVTPVFTGMPTVTPTITGTPGATATADDHGGRR